jgi:hypothetical protein
VAVPVGSSGGNMVEIDIYTAIIDTCILGLLLVWSWMDRNNIYLRDK